VALHVYAPAAAIQLRLEATAAIHIEDEVTNKAWARTPPMSRVVYAMNPPPGTPVSEPPPNPESIDHTATNFAVLRLTFDRLEWLWLSHEGHRRAAFTWDNAANPHATWLAP
jgi:pyridoxamine 5'-phosphate oxidase